MDAGQAFLRVQASSTLQMLTPKVRVALEYMILFIALTLFCFLVFLHGHYVKQPACSSEFSLFVTTGANLMLIKINSAGLWLRNESEPNRVDVPDLKTVAVQWLENKSKTFEPTYLYTIEKGFFLLSENAKARHDIQSMNISISAGHSCFGNRWQQVLINRLVGFYTVLINSLLSSPGQGYVYNYQTKEYYNLSYAQGPLEGSARLGEKFVTKCGILLMSLCVFFTTTTSASVILRETQKQILQFTVELQHPVLRGLPILQLIWVHVLQTLIFVPIMIGILLFMFKFYGDRLLAFMVLAVVWLSEVFVVISVRTPVSMKFFPRFLFLYFLFFHMYFFIYPNGFTYLAFVTMASFTQHLILYFCNCFEVPAFQRFITDIQGPLQNPQYYQIQDYQITQSTVVASTFHITRLNTRDQGSPNAEAATQSWNQDNHPEQPEREQEPDSESNPEFRSSLRGLLSWILLHSYSGFNSLLFMFRGVRNPGQVFVDSSEGDIPEDEVFSDAME